MTEGAGNPVGQWLPGEGGEAGCGRGGEALGRVREVRREEEEREGGLEEEGNPPVKFTSVPGS